MHVDMDMDMDMYCFFFSSLLFPSAQACVNIATPRHVPTGSRTSTRLGVLPVRSIPVSIYRCIYTLTCCGPAGLSLSLFAIALKRGPSSAPSRVSLSVSIHLPTSAGAACPL